VTRWSFDGQCPIPLGWLRQRVDKNGIDLVFFYTGWGYESEEDGMVRIIRSW
jgi:hypothetical protein